jgi:hypothetical protein
MTRTAQARTTKYRVTLADRTEETTSGCERDLRSIQL